MFSSMIRYAKVIDAKIRKSGSEDAYVGTIYIEGDTRDAYKLKDTLKSKKKWSI